MANDSYPKMLKTLAGIYRSYYELVDIDDSFLGKAQIYIIADGYEQMSEDFLLKLEKAGIYNEFKTKRFRSVELLPGAEMFVHKYKNLGFINESNMNDQKQLYGTANVAHCFSRKSLFTDFYQSLQVSEAEEIKVNNEELFRFMLGENIAHKGKGKKIRHLPITCHFVIKHYSQGNVDSHRWFFKGF